MAEDEHIELYRQKDISSDHFGKPLIISYIIFRNLIDLIFAEKHRLISYDPPKTHLEQSG